MKLKLNTLLNNNTNNNKVSIVNKIVISCTTCIDMNCLSCKGKQRLTHNDIKVTINNIINH